MWFISDLTVVKCEVFCGRDLQVCHQILTLFCRAERGLKPSYKIDRANEFCGCWAEQCTCDL